MECLKFTNDWFCIVTSKVGVPQCSNNGDRPQGIINNQVVRNCDMLIGAFWTRLGSPTGVEESGTVEEIKWFLKQQKPVMLYYSKTSGSRSY